MKNLLILLFLLPLFSVAQNPYTVTTRYLTGDCAKPDTTISTTVVTGKSGYFSSKVTLTAVSTIAVKKYQSPVVTPPANKPPTVTISGTAKITEPASSVTLTAAASDPDGTVTAIAWRAVSGSGFTINSPNGNPTLITGLVAGTYVISATVTDDKGATATASFTITVVGVSTTPPTNPDPPPTTNTADFYQGFETSLGNDNVTFNKYIQQGDNLNLATLTTEQKSAGSKSAKLVLSKVNAAAKARVEFTMIGTDVLKEGSERIYEFDIRSADVAGDYMYTFFQTHHDKDSFTPPFMIGKEQGSFLVSTVPTYGGGDVYSRNLAPFEANRWYHVKVHIIFSSTAGKGLAVVSVDGKEIYNNPKVPTLFADQTSYMKMGIYNWGFSLSQNPSITEYIDEFKCYVIKP